MLIVVDQHIPISTRLCESQDSALILSGMVELEWLPKLSVRSDFRCRGDNYYIEAGTHYVFLCPCGSSAHCLYVNHLSGFDP